jgi:3alpha(or 20beta)-hydroxysteroid dehydrogenase
MSNAGALFSLAGQVAVVTGGASGIGLATAERFAVARAQVVIADLSDAREAAESVGAVSVRCDVTREDELRDALKFAVKHFGKLNILVNNAGVFSGYDKITNKDASDFERCFKVNVLGAANGIKCAAELMSDDGRIINVASAAGLIGVSGLADYAASKHAVLGLTKSAALELADRRIRVTVNTPMAHEEGGQHMLDAERLLVPLGRICEPEEVAALIHFLASNDCNFVNGQAIAIDGGMSAGGSERLYAKLIS